jgi:hypothetical protein
LRPRARGRGDRGERLAGEHRERHLRDDLGGLRRAEQVGEGVDRAALTTAASTGSRAVPRVARKMSSALTHWREAMRDMTHWA